MNQEDSFRDCVMNYRVFKFVDDSGVAENHQHQREWQCNDEDE